MSELELDKQLALRSIPKDVLDEFIKTAITSTCKKIKADSNFSKNENKTNQYTIFTDKGEVFIESLNNYIAMNLSNFIEAKTKIPAKKFFRNINLFESTVVDNLVNIYWV